jgi:hypothetical protein
VKGVRASLLECDEVWAYVGRHQRCLLATDPAQWGDRYTLFATDPVSKLVPSFLTGRRDGDAALAFARDVRARILGKPQVSVDGWPCWYEAFRTAFGWNGVDLGASIKEYDNEATPKDPGRKYSPGWVKSAAPPGRSRRAPKAVEASPRQVGPAASATMPVPLHRPGRGRARTTSTSRGGLRGLSAGRPSGSSRSSTIIALRTSSIGRCRRPAITVAEGYVPPRISAETAMSTTASTSGTGRSIGGAGLVLRIVAGARDGDGVGASSRASWAGRTSHTRKPAAARSTIR